MTAVAWVATAGTVAVLTLLIVTALARTVARDGHGYRPAPRGTADWSVGALPSRPYGT